MSWTRVLALGLVVGLTTGLLGPVASAEEIGDDLAAVARTGPGGRGSIAARKATDRLARNGLEHEDHLDELMSGPPGGSGLDVVAGGRRPLAA